ncbi:MAG: MBL fold metallo-hydrolase [Candidatus Micrarchaeota archaeon]|nr:MBL fold metallo-hydrolase [Candidatus Micrarchaeota archaeon]
MEIGKELVLLGNSGFLMKHGGNNIYIDPFMLPATDTKADLILITHAHQDHYSPDSIDKILKSGTKIIASRLCEGIEKYQNVKILEPGQSSSAFGIKIDSVPAYNTNPSKLKWHPRENKWMGYIIEVDGRRIYHSGDTDFIPEMKKIDNIYAALLPMGDTYTMGVDEMIEAARAIGADITVPIHYKMQLERAGGNWKEAEQKVRDSISSARILEEVKP